MLKKSTILILGCSGQVGAPLAQESLRRGHRVIGVSRSAGAEVLDQPEASHILGDAYDEQFLTPLVRRADVVVNALRPKEGHESELVGGSLIVQRVCSDAGVRMVVSGGAAVLPVSEDGQAPRVIDTQYVQDAWRAIAQTSVKQYDALVEANPDGNWVYIAAPAALIDGQRRGGVRRSSRALVTDSGGNSELSVEDFCDLIMDEIEHPSGARLLTGAY